MLVQKNVPTKKIPRFAAWSDNKPAGKYAIDAKLCIINRRPIFAGDKSRALPKAGITIYMAIGTRSFAQWPIENGIKRSGFLLDRDIKSSKTHLLL